MKKADQQYFMKNTHLWLLVFCALAGVVLAGVGCKSSKAKELPRTHSGVPEVTLAARPAKEIQAVTREFFLSRGYVETRSQHAYELVFDKPAGSGRSGRAVRIRLRLYQQADGSWRLVGRPMGVEAWRSDLESEVDVPHGASQIQDFLEEIRSRTESNHAP